MVNRIMNHVQFHFWLVNVGDISPQRLLVIAIQCFVPSGFVKLKPLHPISGTICLANFKIRGHKWICHDLPCLWLQLWTLLSPKMNTYSSITRVLYSYISIQCIYICIALSIFHIINIYIYIYIVVSLYHAISRYVYGHVHRYDRRGCFGLWRHCPLEWTRGHPKGADSGAGGSGLGRLGGSDWDVLYIFIWVWVNTYRYIFSGMNIHLQAILGFTRYQGFDPSPYLETAPQK